MPSDCSYAIASFLILYTSDLLVNIVASMVRFANGRIYFTSEIPSLSLNPMHF